MIAARTAAAAAATCAVAAFILAGCTGHTTPGPTTYVTVPAPTSSAASSTSPPASATSPTAGPTHSVAAMNHLPGRCESLLPLASVVDKVGHKVDGATAFVVGDADATIARVSYLNCRYGVSSKIPTPEIEIGVSLYRTAAKAAARIPATIDDYVQHGATAAKTTVDAMPATVLEGGSGAGYGPTIVLSFGQRTIAVSLRSGAFAAAEVSKTLLALAALATDRTSGG